MAHPAARPSYQPSGASAAPAAAPDPAECHRLVAAGRTAEARACFEKLVAARPHDLDALNNLGVLHLMAGDADAAIAMFGRALAIDPAAVDIRNNYVKTNLRRGQALVEARQHARAIANYRRVLAVEPDNFIARTSLTNARVVTGEPAELGDFMPAGAAPLGVHALIACMPKSGSTFLKATLCRLTGWAEAGLAYAYLQNEQELYLPNLVAVADANTVTQQHCRATEANIHMLQGFGIRPVVLIRNLCDIVMSLVDFYDGGAVLNTFIGADWPALSPEARRDFVIDHLMPWYVAFYASWRRAAAARRLDCLFVRYEDMLADKPATIFAIAGFLGLAKTLDECRASVAAIDGNRGATRFNRGVAGRGAAALNHDQRARLRRLAESYRSVDFAPIGL